MATKDTPATRPRGIVDLPAELHDLIWSYLDWDSSDLLLPDRPDIIALSKTCSALRKAVLPVLFRHVVLRLRWAQGALYEPTLMRLRRTHPDLAQYIRTVHIQAEYGQADEPISWSYAEYDKLEYAREKWQKYEKRCLRISEHPALVVGKTMQQWLDPANTEQILPYHASRVHDLIQSLVKRLDKEHANVAWLSASQKERRRKNFESQRNRMLEAMEKSAAAAEGRRRANIGLSPFGGEISPDDDQGQDGYHPSSGPYLDRRMTSDPPRAKLELEALAIAVSCIPGAVTNIIVDACPVPAQRHFGPQHSLVLAIAAAAANMLGAGLNSLTVATPEVLGRQSMAGPSSNVLCPDALHFGRIFGGLAGLQTLRLTGHANAVMSETKFNCWLPLLSGPMSSNTLRSVGLWDAKFIDHELCDWLSKLQPGPAQLVLHDVVIQKDRRPPAQATQNDTGPINSRNAYLAFVLNLRAALPSTTLVLENVTSAAWNNTVPAAGRRFVEAEVCTVTGVVTVERQQRLLQDCASFMPHWLAEEQSDESVDDTAKQFGKLIDAAMASRSYRQWS